MARRTKADAQATRNSLLDAAEHLFQERGVSRTSLNDIAVAAGTTRGAIYWHFKDKADLFNAMMERVTLPMEQSLQRVSVGAAGGDPVAELREALLEALRVTATDEQARRVFDIAIQKVEYVDELTAVKQRRLQCRCETLTRIAQALELAVTQRDRPLPVPLRAATMGLMSLLEGLLQNWLLAPQAFDLVEVGGQALDTYLAGLGLRER